MCTRQYAHMHVKKTTVDEEKECQKRAYACMDACCMWRDMFCVVSYRMIRIVW